MDPALVPLHLILEGSLKVDTKNAGVQSWLRRTLVDEAPLCTTEAHADEVTTSPVQWHTTDAEQSNIGILLQPCDALESPRVTEVLIYAQRAGVASQDSLPTPPDSSDREDDRGHEFCSNVNGAAIEYRALLLSSDLLYRPLQGSATIPEPENAVFVGLAPQCLEADQASHKKRLGSLFDEASDRNKKAKRRTAQSISVAASHAVDSSRPLTPSFTSKAREQIARDKTKDPNLRDSPKILQARRRAADDDPPSNSARRTSHVSEKPASFKRQSSQGQVVTQGFSDDSVEAKNKQAISRIVMAGMRLYGLQQRKSQSARRTSSALVDSGKLETGDDQDTAREENEEYKAVYHQTYKATLFAFVSAECIKMT